MAATENAGALRQIVHWFGVAMLAVTSCVAHGQGGPPLVTDDPGTPGDGHWEINLAAIAQTVEGVRTLALPDADINYGLGDRIQLKLDVPLTFAREPDGHITAGPGTSELGVKWRFIDGGESGPSVSTYPQFIFGWNVATTKRGIAEPGHQYFLPIEVTTPVGKFTMDGELGRNFTTVGPDQWLAGLILARDCREGTECMAEVHEIISSQGNATLLNLGLRHDINKSVRLLMATGYEFGPAGADPRHLLIYAGFQLLR